MKQKKIILLISLLVIFFFTNISMADENKINTAINKKRSFKQLKRLKGTSLKTNNLLTKDKFLKPVTINNNSNRPIITKKRINKIYNNKILPKESCKAKVVGTKNKTILQKNYSNNILITKPIIKRIPKSQGFTKPLMKKLPLPDE